MGVPGYESLENAGYTEDVKAKATKQQESQHVLQEDSGDNGWEVVDCPLLKRLFWCFLLKFDAVMLHGHEAAYSRHSTSTYIHVHIYMYIVCRYVIICVFLQVHNTASTVAST